MTLKERIEEIVDKTFGVFLKDKDNPIYKNLKNQSATGILKAFREQLENHKKHLNPKTTTEEFLYNQVLQELIEDIK